MIDVLFQGPFLELLIFRRKQLTEYLSVYQNLLNLVPLVVSRRHRLIGEFQEHMRSFSPPGYIVAAMPDEAMTITFSPSIDNGLK